MSTSCEVTSGVGAKQPQLAVQQNATKRAEQLDKCCTCALQVLVQVYGPTEASTVAKVSFDFTLVAIDLSLQDKSGSHVANQSTVDRFAVADL